MLFVASARRLFFNSTLLIPLFQCVSPCLLFFLVSTCACSPWYILCVLGSCFVCFLFCFSQLTSLRFCLPYLGPSLTPFVNVCSRPRPRPLSLPPPLFPSYFPFALCILGCHSATVSVSQVVKTYPLPGGRMSQHIVGLEPGQPLLCKGPWPKLPYTANKWPHIGMLAGGTGITPMLQVLHVMTRDPEDQTRATLLFANKTEPDILLREELEALAAAHPDRLTLRYVLEDPPPDWAQEKGRISADMVAKYMPAPGPQALVLICGPNGMLAALSGPKVAGQSYTKKLYNWRRQEKWGSGDPGRGVFVL